MKSKQLIECPCQSGKKYHQCCELFHRGVQIPVTAELLMRSRYSAYTLNLYDYIKSTWHHSTYTPIEKQDTPTKWIGLVIHHAWQTETPKEAFVEFTARYKINGKAEKMHEVSRFVYEQNRWLYIDGILS